MKLLITFCSLLFVWEINAQVIINEYSCSNRNGITDAFGDEVDWIELHNIGGASVDLAGYFLSDNDNNLTKWEIPAGATIPAGGYQMVFCSKRDLITGNELHTNFGLTQTKNEWIILSTPGGSISDSLKITKLTQKDHSYGRTTDGALTWSVFVTPTPNASNTGGLNYYTPTPTVSVPAGFYSGAQSVTLSTPDPQATIYYTLDGTTPTTASTVYSTTINISTTSVLRAKAFSSDPSTPPSFTETNTYFIGVTHTLPVLSVCGDQVTDFLNDVAPGSFSSDFDGAFELFEDDGTLVSEGEGLYNKHGNDSWAYDQRGFDMVVRDEYGYTNAVRHPLFPAKNKDEYQRLIIKAAANDNYPFAGGAHLRDAMVHTLSQQAHLRMDERTSKFGIVYVDGQYWGVYDFREKVDDADFTDHYYGQDKFNIAFLKTWGGTWAEYGGQPALDEWDTLKNYIITGDMTDPVQYNNVKSVYNTGSLIDYVVLNSYVVTSDWLNWNTGWWHGHIPPPDGDKQKWRYILWDNDASWGHYINYTGVPSTAPDADPCNPQALPDPGGQGHIPILNKLFLNDEFNQQYITRYADMMNTYFSCDYMNHLLDSMVAVIQPEMPGQIARWGGDIATWQQNVQDLRDFIDARCLAMEQGMIDCFSLNGPYDLTVKVEPPGAGEIKVNSVWAPYYPWTGQYYGGINTLFKASANTGYVFDHWESVQHTFMYPDSTNDTLNLVMADTVIAYFIDTTSTTPIVDPPVIPPPGQPNPSTFAGFHLPNAFSPNQDNNNDFLEFFAGWDITSFELQIYDRWGKMVFKTQTIGDFWDGYYKGKLVNTGIYTYMLTYESTETGSTKTSGNITVLR